MVDADSFSQPPESRQKSAGKYLPHFFYIVLVQSGEDEEEEDEEKKKDL